MRPHQRSIKSRQYPIRNHESVNICSNILNSIVLQSYAIFQHNRILENIMEKNKKEQTITFSNENYEKMLGSYYVSHQDHSSSINQEKCFKNTQKKYCFLSQSIEKKKQKNKEAQTFINEFHKPYIIKKITRLNTMNQTFQNQIARPMYQRLSHNATQLSIQTSGSQNVMRGSMRPVITQNSPVKEGAFQKKLKKMSSTFFTDNFNSIRKQSNRFNSSIRNQVKLETEPAETLVSLIKQNLAEYNQIDRQIDILRQRRIKLQQVVNLFDSQNLKIMKSSDKIKAQKQLSSKRLNFTTDFDGTLLPLFQNQNAYSTNQNVICKVRNKQQSGHEINHIDNKKKKTFLINQNQQKIQRKINKNFSSLIQSAKKFKNTPNQVSQKHSKIESSVEQIKSNKHQKQNNNNFKKIRFEDEKSKKNFQKRQTSLKMTQKSSKQNIISVIEYNSSKESLNDKKNQKKQIKNIQYNEVSTISSRWQRKQQMLKKIQLSAINTKKQLETGIYSAETSQENL